MLVLTRNVGEEVLVGDAMIRILGVIGKQVRLGFDAPQEVHILRKELIKKVEKIL